MIFARASLRILGWLVSNQNICTSHNGKVTKNSPKIIGQLPGGKWNRDHWTIGKISATNPLHHWQNGIFFGHPQKKAEPENSDSLNTSFLKMVVSNRHLCFAGFHFQIPCLFFQGCTLKYINQLDLRHVRYSRQRWPHQMYWAAHDLHQSLWSTNPMLHGPPVLENLELGACHGLKDS